MIMFKISRINNKEEKKKEGKNRRRSTTNFLLTTLKMQTKLTLCLVKINQITEEKMKSSLQSKFTIHQEEDQISNSDE